MSRIGQNDILQRLAAKELTSAEAFRLLKGMEQQSEGTVAFTREWARADLNAGTRYGVVLVFDTGTALYEALLVNSSRVVLVQPGEGYRDLGDDRYEVKPDHTQDYVNLLEALERKQLRAETVLIAWSKSSFLVEEAKLAEALEKSVYSLLHLSQALVQHRLRQPLPVLYLYENDGSIGPHHAAVSGFARAVRLEQPNLLLKAVEVPSMLQPAVLASIVGREAASGDVEVRYADGGLRYAKRFIPVQPDRETEVPYRQNGVYLLTGGAGGLGMLFAEHLARTAKARLILTGRSAPGQEIEEKLKRIRSLGGEAVYVQADAAKRADALHMVDQAKRHFGALHGVIHSAGVLRDSFLPNKTDIEMEAVFAPKVYGTAYLDEASANEPLDFFALFSSTAAVIGSVGQSDYAYGNGFMDSFAERREQLKNSGKRYGRSISFNWPLWSGGGMQVRDADIKQMKKQTGMVPLDIETGLKAFEAGLRSQASQWVQLKGDVEVLRRHISESNRPAALLPMMEPAGAAISEQTEAETDDLRKQAEQLLKRIVSETIKLPIDRLDAEEPMEKYGLDSVMVAKLTQDLEVYFGTLPKTLFFEYLTLAELAGYMADNHRARLLDMADSKPQAQKPSAIAFGMPDAQADHRPREREESGGRRSRFASQPKQANQSSQTSTMKESVLQDDQSTKDEIAIIGVAGRYPQARNIDEFWGNLKAGKDSITEIPSERWDLERYYSEERDQLGSSYGKWGGFLDDVDKFDPLFFQISPSEADYMDPQERLFLMTVYETLEDAGYTRQSFANANVGVYVGAMYGHYQLYTLDGMKTGTAPVTGSFHSSIANRVSYHFNFAGPSIALDTMCSSSLTSVHLACESLLRGECDAAIAGGVNLSIHPMKYVLLGQTGFLSSDGRCRSFGEGGSGYVPGEGAGAVLLKPLKKAIADGDQIYAVIKASSINHGGKTNGYTVPNPGAQAKLIGSTLKKANIDARTITYLEAHGTGTSLGDPIEIAGLMRAFAADTKERNFCSIGSVKSNIGHLESAAGIAAITKVLLQMKHKQLVPSLHTEALNPGIDFDNSAFIVQRELAAWEQTEVDDQGSKERLPRRAGISAFGAGGSNAHLILEEYESKSIPSTSSNGSNQLHAIVLSAKNEERLLEMATRLLDFLNLQRLSKKRDNIDALKINLNNVLAAIVAELLDIRADEIDPEAAFEDYGMDALILSDVVDRLNRVYGLELTAFELSGQLTLNGLTDQLLRGQGETLKVQLNGEGFESVVPAWDGPALADIAYTLQTGRESFEERVAVLASSSQEMLDKLTAFCEGRTESGLLRAHVVGTARTAVQGNIDEAIRLDNTVLLAQAWLQGDKVNWERLHKVKPRRISLPAYPFAQLRCWLPHTEEPVSGRANIRASEQLHFSESAAASAAPDVHRAASLEEKVQFRLKEMMAAILKIPADELQLDANLQQYGFDSIVGIRWNTQIEKEFGQKIDMAVLFEHNTIREIAGYLMGNGIEKWPSSSTQLAIQQPMDLDEPFVRSFMTFLLTALQEGTISADRALALEAMVTLSDRKREQDEA
ncbi:SDR family NAD(P)-dependent oxidoreductase [Paenibacillus harenae]|uniref:SDR family NAD(P)-dependent oxidoreductase n=1 Tax=Paenibacillus harenae TaxID=306543 RepID=UPI0027923D60|nr:SDR family NAD(P)-dependent oxidoreductase [Paenibacillus harenae]MDQ0059024.1 3-oxoacyl-(acyl-carrier-protein) synthase/acyl carrier protein [Paenibacillus harenae]